MSNKTNSKFALVSYVLAPKHFLPFYFKSSHNNKYHCYLLVKFLYKQGYNVYLHNYLDETSIDFTINYDLFIGHNITFGRIAAKLKGDFRKVLLATGSEPNFGNMQHRLRIEELNKRKNADLEVYNDNIVPDFTNNYNLADLILLFGNEFVKSTYDQKFHGKIRLINNVTLHPYFDRKAVSRTNNFLFISSVGQVHRGLDLLLDVFSVLPHKLYVLSSFEAEAGFVDLYYEYLYDRPNIIPVGYISLDSSRFKGIISDVDFIILPSCSEGQSSSVINMMTYGLIPVVPENVGIPSIDDIGVTIEVIDLEGVKRSVNRSLELTDEEFKCKRQATKNLLTRFYAKSFWATLGQMFEEVASKESPESFNKNRN